jgi:glutamate 5-kinase
MERMFDKFVLLTRILQNHKMHHSKKILVKIGSNVLTLPSGFPDRERMAALVNQILELKGLGYAVLVVSSGAVAAGRSILAGSRALDAISQRQIWASIGQIELMNTYSDLFRQKNQVCAQVLVTKEDFRTREHALNMKNCLEALINEGVTPIINENDTVSITELMFTDNDELSGLVASMMEVESLFLLSNVDGIYTAAPETPGAQLIRNYPKEGIELEKATTESKSEFGRGGMLSKANTAKKIAELGIDVYIGNGTQNQILKSLLAKETGTFFKAETQPNSAVKKELPQSSGYSKACIVVNRETKDALTASKTSSLFPEGVIAIEGRFEKGDVLRLVDAGKKTIGLGKVTCDSETAKACIGKSPLVEANYLVINKNGNSFTKK